MKIQALNKTEWNNYLLGCSNATFFHTPMWYDVWDAYSLTTSRCIQFTFESGNSAIFPHAISPRFKRLFTEIVSSPAGTYGGLVSSTGLNANEVDTAFKKIMNRKNLRIRTNPFDLILPIRPPVLKEDFTQVLNLKQEYTSLVDTWSSNHKRAVKKGIKEGIEVTQAGTNDWDEYYNVYIETTKRWKRKVKYPYSKKLFELIKTINSENCKLWVSKYKNKVVAGALCFYYNNHVVYWHGAASERHFYLKPVQVLFSHIIKEAHSDKYHWFDFNPSSGLTGVVQFKEGFGTDKIRCDFINRESLSFKMATKLISLIR